MAVFQENYLWTLKYGFHTVLTYHVNFFKQFKSVHITQFSEHIITGG